MGATWRVTLQEMNPFRICVQDPKALLSTSRRDEWLDYTDWYMHNVSFCVILSRVVVKIRRFGTAGAYLPRYPLTYGSLRLIL